MTSLATNSITEWSNVTRNVFETQILPAQQPAVLRGLVDHWPLVRAAGGEASILYALMAQRAVERKVGVMVAPSSAGGWLHYNDDLSGFTYERRELEFRDLLAYLLAHAATPSVAVAMQSVLADEIVANFQTDHCLDLIAPGIKPRLWIGNAVTVAAHYDPSENIACVLAGRRRFTLFPPEQVENLYIGPVDHTPAGASISLVKDATDQSRFPRYRHAQAAALTAELGPGDAIYIPYLWWHQVESLDPLNLLANYWWAPPLAGDGDPRDAFIHALVALRGLPQSHRRAWRAMFEHYVFEAGEERVAHIPDDRRGILGNPDDEALEAVKRQLAQRLLRVLEP